MRLELPSLKPAVIFLCLGIMSAIVSAFFTIQEIREINRRYPDNEQIPFLLRYPGRMASIKRQYKLLYPAGRTDFWRLVFQIATILLFAMAWFFSK